MRRDKGFTPLEKRIANRQGKDFLTGFTLIELLVVIAVLTLLMAIFLPALQRARKQAKAVVCQVRLKQWGTILALYAVDNRGWLPHRYGSAIWFLRGSYLREGDPNRPSIFHNFNTKGMTCCPMAVKPRVEDTGTFHSGFHDHYLPHRGFYDIEGKDGSTFRAWEITSPYPPFRGSYGFNEDGAHVPNSSLLARRKTDIYSIRGRANIPALLDSSRPSSSFSLSSGPPTSSRSTTAFCINRHNGGINGLFMDWSVRKIGLKELWTLKWHRQFNTANRWTKAGGAEPEDWPEWMRSFKDY